VHRGELAPAGVVGRSPPGFGSAGLFASDASGVEGCSGCVACARWTLALEISINEMPQMTSPAVTSKDARRRSNLAARFP
jgi:hypothetical protein